MLPSRSPKKNKFPKFFEETKDNIFQIMAFRDQEGNTFLHVSNVDFLKNVLEVLPPEFQSSLLSVRNNTRLTPLEMNIGYPAFDFLLDRVKDSDLLKQENDHEQTILSQLIKSKNVKKKFSIEKIIKLLGEEDALSEISKIDKNGLTAFHHAVLSLDEGIVRLFLSLFLKFGKMPCIFGWLDSVMSDGMSLKDYLTQKANASGMTVEKVHASEVLAVLDKKLIVSRKLADVTSSDEPRKKDPRVILSLADNQGRTALIQHVSNRDLTSFGETLGSLSLEDGKKLLLVVDCDGYSALTHAVKTNQASVIHEIKEIFDNDLSPFFSINASWAIPVLCVAAQFSALTHFEMLIQDLDEEIVKSGLTATNKEGKSSLELAIESGSVDVLNKIISLLLEYQLPIIGQTNPFCRAIVRGNLSIFHTLMNNIPGDIREELLQKRDDQDCVALAVQNNQPAMLKDICVALSIYSQQQRIIQEDQGISRLQELVLIYQEKKQKDCLERAYQQLLICFCQLLLSFPTKSLSAQDFRFLVDRKEQLITVWKESLCGEAEERYKQALDSKTTLGAIFATRRGLFKPLFFSTHTVRMLRQEQKGLHSLVPSSL